MLRIVDVADDYDRALSSGFMASEETNRRAYDDRQNFREQVARYRGDEYVDRFNDFSRSLNLDVLASRAIAIGRGINNAFKDDMIYQATSLGDFQHISKVMQNFMMSVPALNYLGRNQRMNSWGMGRDEYSYYDDDPNTNPYYREMMDGWMDDEGDIVSYLCDEDEDTRVAPRLTHRERITLHQNASQLREYLSVSGGYDPTSKENDLL